MEFVKTDHEFYCGIDLHAKSMYVCIQNKSGDVLFHRNLKNDFPLLLQTLQPYQKDIAVGVESTGRICKKGAVTLLCGFLGQLKQDQEIQGVKQSVVEG